MKRFLIAADHFTEWELIEAPEESDAITYIKCEGQAYNVKVITSSDNEIAADNYDIEKVLFISDYE